MLIIIRIGCIFLYRMIIYWRIWLITLGETHWKTIILRLIIIINKRMTTKLQLGRNKIVRMLMLILLINRNKWTLVVVNRGQWVWRIDTMSRWRDWDRVTNSRRW